MKKCKDNLFEARFIPLENNNIKRMAMEQGLYAQLIMPHKRDLKFVATDKIKNEAKIRF